ncbi:MAG: DUF547 domain-containing protein [Flaviramulus sp.]|nr:DUF547 domain-containing protein [Flaviramulus sp.]NNC50976.1 DUF547 domain-containing protein [Flaviramulus sp.]
MKYLQLFFLLILTSTCLGSSRVVEPVPNKISETKKSVEDTIIEKIVIVEKKLADTINNELIKKLTLDTIQINSFDHSIWNNLLQKYVSAEGNVNYKTFKTDRNLLLQYLFSLGENIPHEDWTKHEKLAFWINAYNAMTIDLILRHYPIKSIKDIKDPWEQRYWKLGDKWYNLEEIEHQILRKMNEPRIHFAIVCASYSCPKLLNETYKAETLENQLTEVTEEFLNDKKRNNISQNRLELSKIFQWFSKDFKQDGNIIDFINQYSQIQISEKAKIIYMDYNWGLNE